MTKAGTIAVFLNYQTAHATVKAVGSLQGSQIPVSDIIVVDNASNDGSLALIAAETTGVRFLEASANDGFSAGCNIGIREALRLGADRVLLLNSDVVVEPTAVGALERALDADSRIGIVGPIVVSQQQPGQIESLGMRYAPATGRMRHRGFGAALKTLAPFEREEVDAVSGCAMLIRRAVFERIGLLAEEYFFGFEDLDFCLRARAAGFQSACVGGAVIRHQGHLSIGSASGHRIYFATRNHLLLAGRFPSVRSAPWRWFQAASVLALNLVHVLLTSNVPRLEGLRGFIDGVRDHSAGRYGARPLGRIKIEEVGADRNG